MKGDRVRVVANNKVRYISYTEEQIGMLGTVIKNDPDDTSLVQLDCLKYSLWFENAHLEEV